MQRSIVTCVAAAALGLGTVAMAQQGPGPGPREQRRPAPMAPAGGGGGGGLERQIEELNLSDEQKKQIEPILQDMREKVRQVTQDARERISNVLTDEQRAQFRGRGGADRPADRGPQAVDPVQRMQRAAEELDLTAEQKAKLRDIFAKFRNEFEAARTENAGNRQAMMEATRPLLQDLRAQVNAVLTPEQSRRLQDQLGGPGREGRPRAGNEAQQPQRREQPARPREDRPRENHQRDNRERT